MNFLCWTLSSTNSILLPAPHLMIQVPFAQMLVHNLSQTTQTAVVGEQHSHETQA